MNMTSRKLLTTATVAGLLLGSIGCQCIRTHHDKDQAIRITQQPKSKLAKGGEPVEFETDVPVRGREKPTFHWFLNGALLDPATAKELGITGQDEKRLTIKSVAKEHVGFYECVIEHETPHPDGPIAITDRAELMVYYQSTLTVYGTPIGGSGSAGANNCPPKYVGYVNFRKPDAPYGWRLTNASVGGTASDPNRSDTVVRYFGSTLSKTGCGPQSVAVPSGSDAYRFTIYFTNTVSSGSYSIKLEGFEP